MQTLNVEDARLDLVGKIIHQQLENYRFWLDKVPELYALRHKVLVKRKDERITGRPTKRKFYHDKNKITIKTAFPKQYHDYWTAKDWLFYPDEHGQTGLDRFLIRCGVADLLDSDYIRKKSTEITYRELMIGVKSDLNAREREEYDGNISKKYSGVPSEDRRKVTNNRIWID